MKYFRKLLHLLDNDYVFSVFNKVVSILAGIVTSSLINRFLGPELKGQYSYIVNIVTLVAIIGNLGFYQSYPYSSRQEMENRAQKYLDAFTLQFIVYLTVAAVVGLVTQNATIAVASFLVPMQIMSEQLAMIALVDFIKFRQRMQIVALLVNLLATVLIYLTLQPSVIAALALLYIKDVLFIAVYLVKIKYRPHPFSVRMEFLKYLVEFGIFAMMAAVLNRLNYKLDVLMMERFLPYSEIGLYTVGIGLAEYAWLIPDAFKNVLFARTAKKNSVQSVVTSIKVNTAIILVILAGVLLLGQYVINFLYGVEYSDAYSVTCIIFLGVPAMMLFKLIGPLYIAEGKQKLYFIILAISVVANAALNLILIPMMGKIGAAFASVGSYLVCGLVFYLKFLRDYHIVWYEPLILRKADLHGLIKRVKGGKK